MQLVLSINNGVAIKRFIKILEKSKFNNKTIKYIAPKVLPVSPIKILPVPIKYPKYDQGAK